MHKEYLDSIVSAYEKKMIADLLKLVGFSSTKNNPTETLACLKFFLQKAEDLGFKTKHTSTRDVGIVEMGEGDETLGILVHLDVVDIGDPQKWSIPPFEGGVRDGFVWGRGTADDKGGVIMGLYAMRAVKDLGIPLKRKVWLIVGTSEETLWTDIENFKKEFPLPDFGFSPDGEFPIYNREKGYADIFLDFTHDTSRGIKTLQVGASLNTVPSIAEIEFEDGLSLTTQGVSTHSSTPEKGENALIKLCHEIAATGRDTFDFTRFVNQFLIDASHIKTLGLDDGRDTLNGEWIGSTTIVPTALCLIKDCVRLNINIRHKYGTTLDDIVNAFERHAGDYGFTVHVDQYLEPMRVAGDLPFLKTMQEVSQEYGIDHGLKLAFGTSYAKSMPNVVSWGPLFTNDLDTTHMEDERLSIHSMMKATKIYARFISRMCLE